MAKLPPEVPSPLETETVPLPRSTGLIAGFTLIGLSVRNLSRVRRLVVITLLFLLPSALILLIRALARHAFEREGPEAYFGLEFGIVLTFIPQVLLQLTALLFASGMIQDEIEDQTLTYLMIRPIPKSVIFLAKWFAVVFVAGLVFTLFTTLSSACVWSYAEVLSGREWLARTAAIVGCMLASLCAYAAFFGFISLLFKRSLILGVVYIIIFEGVIANVPLFIREYTIMYYLRVAMLHSVTFPDRMAGDFRRVWGIDFGVAPSLAGALTTLGVVTLVFLLLSSYFMSTREFRLKTPEGN